MTGTVPAGPHVVLCRSCDGLSFTLVRCSCTYGGNRLLVSADDWQPGEPYHDCLECDGVGTVGRPCHDCGQTGRRRAQRVLTMVNIDTGAVASASVVPGVVRPEPWLDDGDKSWCLPLAPLLHELAATVGAGSWTDVREPHSTDGPLIPLPPGWRPEHSASHRKVLEAQAIAWQSSDAWRLYLGRTAVPPPPDPAADLGRRCRLADLLCLDLVVEVRRQPYGAGLTWALRYELPGGPVPAEPRGYAADLATAITTTSDADACYGLDELGRTVAAHQLTPSGPPPAEPPTIDLDQLERRILADCVDLTTGAENPGAQAIWRDGGWWHTSLRDAGTLETLSEQSTGQILSRHTTLLRRGWQPPAPSWLGPPIEYVDCPDCDPNSRLQHCDCRLFGDRADPDCVRCAGSGRSPSLMRCFTCGGTRRIHRDVTVTITDLAGRVVHLTWSAGGPGWRTGVRLWRLDKAAGQARPAGEELWRSGEQVPAPHVATHPGGKPLHQLPGQFRLGGWADTFDIRPEDLVELDGRGQLDQDLRYGTVTLHHLGADPLTEYVTHAARSRPGARLFLLARRPDVPPLADVVRLVLGLRLGITVTVVDHAPNAGDLRLVQGESWDVTIDCPGREPAPADPPGRPTPEAATAFCLDYLDLAIAGNVPADPEQSIPVPQTPTPIEVDDPVPFLRRLARHHAGQPVAVHYTGTTCQVWLRDRDCVRQLATAPTLPAAVGALGL
ncbi:hypothetical protein [Plantactinospora sp. B5E13]|uniref:hypothetical protein n=1 Tax=Plantactinospora sp. B5E13 TaxID=3153758 RepID=UPI00325F03D5